MKEKFLDNSLIMISKYNSKYTETDLEKMRYGLEGIYLTVFKMIVIIVASIVLNIFKEVMLVLLFYNALRFFGFGMHARTSNECLFISSTLFILLPLLIFKDLISFNLILYIYPLLLLSFFLFAPADTVKRPLTNKKKRLKRKVATMIVASIYIVICIVTENMYVTRIISAALIIESLMISPVTYKLFGQSYNNYKNID